MDEKQIEIEINKLFIKHAIRSQRPLPELLYEDIFNLITKAIQVQAKVKPANGNNTNKKEGIMEIYFSGELIGWTAKVNEQNINMLAEIMKTYEE